MDDTLGLLEEALQLAHEIGYTVREEPLGDLPGGPCVVGGRRTILLNLQSPAADRLPVLLTVLARDPAVASQPVSRLLAGRLQAIADEPQGSMQLGRTKSAGGRTKG
jgi:hypothetical protein